MGENDIDRHGSGTETAMYSQAYRTKVDIASAFNMLCESEPFSKIRVETIAHAANVSRSSFYYHFEDKHAVVNWLTQQFYASGIDEIGRSLTWFEGHLITTKQFVQYRALLNSGGRLDGYNAGVPTFIRHRQENLMETLVDIQKKELTQRLQFQIEALPHSEYYMTDKFLRGDFGNMRIKQFCDLVISLVPHDLYEALETPAIPTDPTSKGHFFEL